MIIDARKSNQKKSVKKLLSRAGIIAGWRFP
jgi:hypothetical protein